MSKNYFQMLKDGILVDGSGGGDAPAPVLITKSVTANGTYDAIDDEADGYSTVSVDVPNSYTAQDEGKVVQSGALVAQGSDSVTTNGTVDTTLISSLTVNVSGGTDTPPQQSTKPALNDRASFTSVWTEKTWNGLTDFNGSNIWTDGDNIYYSILFNQYVLDKSTSTWSKKTWNGLTSFSSNSIWTDGDNIYHSNDTNQYVLDKSTSTWSPKTWTGLTNFRGDYIWTDGDNIYYSNDTNQYVLDKSTSTWSPKTWNGLTNFYGVYIWTDGDNIYYSNSSTHYVLVKSASTWSPKTWTGLTSFDGNDTWTDGDNIYHSTGSSQYILSKAQPTYTTLSCKPKFTA